MAQQLHNASRIFLSNFNILEQGQTGTFCIRHTISMLLKISYIALQCMSLLENIYFLKMLQTNVKHYTVLLNTHFPVIWSL